MRALISGIPWFGTLFSLRKYTDVLIQTSSGSHDYPSSCPYRPLRFDYWLYTTVNTFVADLMRSLKLDSDDDDSDSEGRMMSKITERTEHGGS